MNWEKKENDWLQTICNQKVMSSDTGHKELDIVAEKDGTLVFVEVKTRKDVLFGLPEDAVTNGKIRRIVSSADAYLRKYAIDLPVRFDLITIVTGENGLPRLRHIEDAFYPPLY